MGYDDAFKTFPVLTTKRLVLRQLRPMHAAECHKLAATLPPTHWPKSERRSVYAARKEIRQHLEWYRKREVLQWGLFDRRRGGLRGVIVLGYVIPGFRAEVSYWLGTRFHGRGLMTEALTEVVRFGFDEMDLHRIWAHTGATYAGSRRLLERVGFSFEGILRHVWLYAGEYRDAAGYGFLSTDPRPWGKRP